MWQNVKDKWEKIWGNVSVVIKSGVLSIYREFIYCGANK